MGLLTLLREFGGGSLDQRILRAGVDSYLQQIMKASPAAYYRMGDLPPVPANDLLRWRAPDQVNPTIVTVPDSGFFSQTLGEQEDAIIVMPATTRNSGISIVKGRHLRVIGGGFSALGGATGAVMRFSDVLGSISIEGVQIEANGQEVIGVAYGGSLGSDRSLWYKYPDLIVQNSRMMGFADSGKMIQPQYPAGRIYIDKFTGSSSGYGLFITPGFAMRAAYLSRINLIPLGSGAHNPWLLFLLENDDSTTGPEGLIPYPIFLDDVHIGLLEGVDPEEEWAFPAAGMTANGVDVGIRIGADGTGSWPSPMKVYGSIDSELPAVDYVPDSVAGPTYSQPGFVPVVFRAVIGADGDYAENSKHLFDVPGATFEEETGAHQFGELYAVPQSVKPPAGIVSGQVMGSPSISLGTPRVSPTGITSKEALGADTVNVGISPSSKNFITRTGKNLMYRGSAMRLKGVHSHQNGSHGDFNFGATSGDANAFYVRDARELQVMSDIGMNHVRWSFSYADWAHTPNRSAFFGQLDAAIASAKAANMWVIPMCFTYPTDWWTTSPNRRSQPSGKENAPDAYDGYSQVAFPPFYDTLTTLIAGGTGNVFQDMFTTMWKDIALRYKDEEAIAMWDVFNEPNAGSARATNYWKYMQHLYAQIKSVDPNHLISIPFTIWYPQTPTAAGISNFVSTCPDVVYQNHDYEPLNMTHSDPPAGGGHPFFGTPEGHGMFINPKVAGATPGTWKATVRNNAGTPANKDFILYDASDNVLDQCLNVTGGTIGNFVAAINALNSPRIFARPYGNTGLVIRNTNPVVQPLGAGNNPGQTTNNSGNANNMSGDWGGAANWWSSWWGSQNFQTPANFQTMFATKELDFINFQNNNNVPIYMGEWGTGGVSDSRSPHYGNAKRQARKASYLPMFAQALDNMGWSWAVFEWRHHNVFETQAGQGSPGCAGLYRTFNRNTYQLADTSPGAEAPAIDSLRPLFAGSRRPLYAGQPNLHTAPLAFARPTSGNWRTHIVTSANLFSQNFSDNVGARAGWGAYPDVRVVMPSFPVTKSLSFSGFRNLEIIAGEIDIDWQGNKSYAVAAIVAGSTSNIVATDLTGWPTSGRVQFRPDVTPNSGSPEYGSFNYTGLAVGVGAPAPGGSFTGVSAVTANGIVGTPLVTHFDSRRGIVLTNFTGVAHIEGVWFHGDLSEGIQINCNNNPVTGAIMRYQAMRIDLNVRYPEWGTSAPTVAAPFGENRAWENHGDAIQNYAGPNKVEIDKVTLVTPYQGLYLQIQDPNLPGGGFPLANWQGGTIKRLQVNPLDPTHGRTMIQVNGEAQAAKVAWDGPIYISQIPIGRKMDTSGTPYQTVEVNYSNSPGTTLAAAIAAGKIKGGNPPGGDFAPASPVGVSGGPNVPGINYSNTIGYA